MCLSYSVSFAVYMHIFKKWQSWESDREETGALKVTFDRDPAAYKVVPAREDETMDARRTDGFGLGLKQFRIQKTCVHAFRDRLDNL